MLKNILKVLNKNEIIGILSYGDSESINVFKSIRRKGFYTKMLVVLNEFIDKDVRKIERSFVKSKEYGFSVLDIKILKNKKFFVNHPFIYREYFRNIYRKIEKEILIDSLVVCDNNFLSKYRKVLVLKNEKIYEINTNFHKNSGEIYFLLPLISKYVKRIDKDLLDKIRFYRKYYKTDYVFSIRENTFLVHKEEPPLYYIKEVLLKSNKVPDIIIFSFSKNIEKLERWLRFP